MTRAADRLGGGSSFGAVRPRSERGRAKAVAEGAIPDYELQRFPLDKVQPSLVNPRRYFGTDEEQETLGHSLARKQTTACVAVTRAAYLTLWPDHETDIGTAEWIILNGERRYRSARRVGLEHLDFVVRDDLATTRADFIDYLMLENDERQDFNIIERAHGLADLLRACDGNAAEVARRRGKDRSWVGNQIALLTLPTDLQHMLVAGTLAERYARRLARALKDDPFLGSKELLDLAERLREQERDRRSQEKDIVEAARNTVLSADNTAQGTPTEPGASPAPAVDSPRPAASAPAASQEPSPASFAPSEMLSADNIPEQRIVGGAAVDGPADGSAALLSGTTETGEGVRGSSAGPVVLSADNTTADDAADAAPGRAAHLVRALGETAAEQAATLRAGLDDEQYTALLEALYASV